jgi:hypothetical protein
MPIANVVPCIYPYLLDKPTPKSNAKVIWSDNSHLISLGFAQRDILTAESTASNLKGQSPKQSSGRLSLDYLNL